MMSVTNAARPVSVLALALAALLALLLSGCGGGGMSVGIDDTNQDTLGPTDGGSLDPNPQGTDTGTQDSSPGTPTGDGGTPQLKFGTMLPLGSPLPDVPEDDVKASSKVVSTILDYPGADFMLAAGGTVDGDELVLESSEEFTAWAMYRADGLSDLDIEIYSIEAVPGDLGQNYEVAFSDFTTNDWVFLINSKLPEAEVNLAQADGQFVSALGNLYFLVTVDGGNSVRISVSHLLTADETPGDPGDPNDPGPGPFIGELVEIDEDSFTLDIAAFAPLFFRYDDETMWFDMFGEPISPASLIQGDLLLVEAVEETDSAWYAIGVMLLERSGGGPGDPGDPNEPVFVEGEILSIGNGLISLVDGIEVNYNSDTQWFGENGPASEEDFAPGDYVFIEAVLMENSKGLLALTVFGLREIPPGDPGDPGVPKSFIGEITAIDDTTITLERDLVFAHDEETLWFDMNGEAGPEDFAPGDLVQVDAVETDTGMLAIMVLSLEGNGGGPGDPGDPLIYIGEITDIGPGNLVLDGDISFMHDESTIWLNDAGEASWEDFDLGDLVHVEAENTDAGLRAAVVLDLGRNSADIVFLTGVIASIGDGQIMLDNGIVIAYNEQTVWYDELLNIVGPDAFAAGDRVYIVALAFTGDLLAAYVYKLPDDPIRGGGGDPAR